jgi:hypothetical protein
LGTTCERWCWSTGELWCWVASETMLITGRKGVVRPQISICRSHDRQKDLENHRMGGTRTPLTHWKFYWLYTDKLCHCLNIKGWRTCYCHWRWWICPKTAYSST